MNVTIEALRGAIQRSVRLHQIGGHTLTVVDGDVLDAELAMLEEPETAADDSQMGLLQEPEAEQAPAPEAAPAGKKAKGG